jgi:ubiquinone/menaquinone biosynthesis C-methylase UbiE
MKPKSTYVSFAPIYDDLFFALGKDYQAEAYHLTTLIQKYKESTGNQLLDMACGTGEHIRHLKNNFEIVGIDISPEMLSIAKQKNPAVCFYEADMLDFQLDKQFDVILCLFSAIGYLVTKRKLGRVVQKVSNHLKRGGIYIVEPWYSPEDIYKQMNLVEYGEKEGIKACRMRETEINGKVVKSKGYILVSKNGHVSCLTSNHVFGLFSPIDFIDAYEKSGLEMCSTEQDLSGRGLYIGRKR